MKNGNDIKYAAERSSLGRRVRTIVDETPWLKAVVHNEILWGTVFAALIVLLLLPLQPLQGDRYQLGDLAREMIIAPRDMLVPDQEATERIRKERMDSVKSVYRFRSNTWRTVINRISLLFQHGRDSLDATADGSTLDRDNQFLETLRETISADPNIQIKVPLDVLGILVRLQFSDEVQSVLAEIYADILRRPVADLVLNPPRPAGVAIIPEGSGGDKLVSLSDARDQLAAAVMEKLTMVSVYDRSKLATWLETLVIETAEPDVEATGRALDGAADSVAPRFFEVKKGELIALRGDRIDEKEQLAIVNQIIETRAGAENLFYRAISLTLFTAFFLYTLSKFGNLLRRRRPVTRHLFILLGLTLTINLAIIRVGMLICDSFASYISAPTFQNAQLFYWIIPFPAGSMLLALLVGSGISILYSITLVMLCGFLFAGQFAILLYAMTGSFIVIYGLRKYRERTALIKSGIALGLMNIIVILSITILNDQLSADPSDLIISLFIGFIGGILTAFVASFVLPVLESLFQLTTDIKLLELSNHEHPLLRDLFIRAPGTFQHSIVVGYLAEAAANAIGANGLFCRVACLYHDVGKLLKPKYYVENTDDLGDKHRNLTPHMSALVIISHVKDGMELARRHKLPESIIDIIPQHHGTRLIMFFFEKARRQRKPELGEVNEGAFRYPGPKPQTREAGIIMIADGIEAAARTLSDSSVSRLKGLIKTLIDNTFLEGQLDECDLTLKDLSKIAEAFLKILTSMHHERIRYPGVQLEPVTPRRGTPKRLAEEVAGAGRTAAGETDLRKVGSEAQEERAAMPGADPPAPYSDLQGELRSPSQESTEGGGANARFREEQTSEKPPGDGTDTAAPAEGPEPDSKND